MEKTFFSFGFLVLPAQLGSVLHTAHGLDLT